MKKVSIIVPIYNVEKYLRKCIESILNQTYKNIELILINDGSPDNSADICVEYSKRDKRIKFISQDNSGVSIARNTGIKEATGDYILFIDSDDYIEKYTIETLVNSVEDKDMIVCSYYKEKEEKPKKEMPVTQKYLVSKKNMLQQIHTNKAIYGYIWNKLYKKSIIDKYNIEFRSNIAICEDLLFNIEYLDKADTDIVITNEKLYHYIMRGNSAVNAKNINKKLTALASYQIIEELYKEKYPFALEHLYCGIFQMYFRLKLDTYIVGIKDKEKIALYNKKMKETYRIIIRNKDIRSKLKLKYFIEKNLFIFIALLGKVIKI